jgi:hypothetical protein
MHGYKPVTKRQFAIFHAQFVFKPEMLMRTASVANYAILVVFRLKTFNTRRFVGVLLYKIQEIHFAQFYR